MIPGTELEFGDHVNLLLGRNGTGKTTLLKWIDMALRFNFGELQREDFHFEYELEGDAYWLTVEVENEFVAHDPQDLVASLYGAGDWVGRWHFVLRWKDPGSPYPNLEATTSGGWRPHLTVEETKGCRLPANWALSESGPLRLLDRCGDTTTLQYTQPDQGLQDSRLLDRLVGAVGQACGRAHPAPLESPANPQLALRFDEARVWWDQFLTSASPVARYVERPIQLPAPVSVTGEIPPGSAVQFSIGVAGDRIISRVIGQPMAMLFPTFRPEEWSSGQPQLSFLHTGIKVLEQVVEALGLKSIRLTLDLARARELPPTETQPGGNEYEYSTPRFFITRRDGRGFLSEGLSFGQQRLFAFLCYLEVWPGGPVLADELPNGMHHGMIDFCLDAIGDRQAFLATQNPLLVDHMGFSSAEEVRKSFVLCDTREHNGREQMDWRTMTEAEADTFFKDFQVGIQHVNEILRLRGLW